MMGKAYFSQKMIQISPSCRGWVRAAGSLALLVLLAAGAAQSRPFECQGKPVARQTKAVLSAEDVSTEIIEALQPVKLIYLDFPPLTYTENGKPSGFFIGLTLEALEGAGLAYTITEMPVGRIYKNLEEGIGHLFIGPQSGAGPKAGTVLTSRAVLGVVKANIFRLDSTPEMPFEQLYNTVLIVHRRYLYGGLLSELKARPNLSLLEVPSHLTAVVMLKAGRAPYVFDYQRPFSEALKNHPEVDVLSTPVLRLPIALVVSKKSPHPQALLALLEASLARVKARRNALPDTKR